jgi:hypothetical protein
MSQNVTETDRIGTNVQKENNEDKSIKTTSQEQDKNPTE